MSDYKSFETSRLILRPTVEEDSNFIYQLLNSPKWLANIGDRKVFSDVDAKRYICAKMLPQLQQFGYSNYTVIRKKDGAKIGVCGLYNRNGIEGVDIGFAFLPEFEKKGYAFESASELKRAAIEEFGIKDLKAITNKNNRDSQKLLEKLGLRYKCKVVLPDEREELLLYSV